ncbi:hypothetical protein GCM10011487_70260 [Steroidobacter agaridevorans]|uniref:Methylamine utilization protein MauE n=1 Tax=Steroidobacter agaridevorans TaxID=2695856 RepID=A0A829YRI0_9GAMM|nr:MauE/DoxX family redox-associated membrane protein [Steroidobacter agaridevorans]GFE85026.1 hypothetical protein GCM10011487_70260 [Steroidobacter agaridevorans]GFE86894.1 hypothetical protein GCM10011488_18480 [Steroidobacter agaridevorans]
MIPQIALAVQLAVGLIFLWSSLSKLAHPVSFVEGLSEYAISRTMLATPIAVGVILAEGFIALSHLTGGMLASGVFGGIVLLLSFASVLVVVLKRGKPVRCLCFGVTQQEPVSFQTFARVGLLLAAELLLQFLQRAGLHWNTPLELTPSDLLAALLCAALAVLAASWVIVAPEILIRLSNAVPR